jgi:hypothetical protein
MKDQASIDIFKKHKAVIYDPVRCGLGPKPSGSKNDSLVLYAGGVKGFNELKAELAKEKQFTVKRINLNPYRNVYGPDLNTIPMKMINGLPNSSCGFSYMYTIKQLYETPLTKENITLFIDMYTKFNYLNESSKSYALTNLLKEWDPKQTFTILEIITNMKEIYEALTQPAYLNTIKEQTIEYILENVLGKYMDKWTKPFAQPYVMGGANMPRCLKKKIKGTGKARIKDIDVCFLTNVYGSEKVKKVRDGLVKDILSDKGLGEHLKKVANDIWKTDEKPVPGLISLTSQGDWEIMGNVNLKTISLKIAGKEYQIMDISIQSDENKDHERRGLGWTEKDQATGITYISCEYMERDNDYIIERYRAEIAPTDTTRYKRVMLQSVKVVLKFISKNLELRNDVAAKVRVDRTCRNLEYMDRLLYDNSTVIGGALLEKVRKVVGAYQKRQI